MGKKIKSREWQQKQIQLLKELKDLYTSKKWKNISKAFKRSGFRRSQLEIRDKWVNHLDPHLKNDEWRQQQLQILYEKINQFGSKWCLIQNVLSDRTQNKIKNKFYGSLRIYLRTVLHYFDKQASKRNNLINKIPPCVLNNVYRAQQDFSFLQSEIPTQLKQMNYNVDKKILQSKIEEKITIYKQLYCKIIQVFKKIQQNEQIKNFYQNDSNQQSDQKSRKQNRSQLRQTKKTSLQQAFISSSIDKENKPFKNQKLSLEATQISTNDDTLQKYSQTVISLQKPKQNIFKQRPNDQFGSNSYFPLQFRPQKYIFLPCYPKNSYVQQTQNN